MNVSHAAISVSLFISKAKADTIAQANLDLFIPLGVLGTTQPPRHVPSGVEWARFGERQRVTPLLIWLRLGGV